MMNKRVVLIAHGDVNVSAFFLLLLSLLLHSVVFFLPPVVSVPGMVQNGCRKHAADDVFVLVAVLDQLSHPDGKFFKPANKFCQKEHVACTAESDSSNLRHHDCLFTCWLTLFVFVTRWGVFKKFDWNQRD